MNKSLVVLLLGTLYSVLAATSSMPRTTTTLFASSTFPVNADYVVTTGPTIATTSLSGTELGPCICDLTFATCDWNCNCDPDCTTAEKAAFTYTLTEGPSRDNITRCVDPAVVTVNKRGDITVDVFTNLVCVTKDNSPSKGFYLDTPTSFTSAELDAIKQQSTSIASTFTTAAVKTPSPTKYAIASHNKHGQMTASISASGVTTLSTSSSTSTTPPASSDASISPLATTTVTYQTGGTIPRATGTTTLTSAVPAFLPLPASDLVGLCSDQAPAYAFTTQKSTCTFSTRTVDGATACAASGLLDAARLFKDAWVANVPGALIDDITQWRSIVVARVDNTISGVTTNTFSLTGGVSYTFPAPVWDATTCTCTGALVGADYTIASTAGAIDGVYVSLQTATVTTTSTGGVCDAVTFQQEFNANTVATSLVSSAGVVTSAPTQADPEVPVLVAADNSVVVNQKSGNPGYLTGFPVLAGSKTTLTNTAGASVSAVLRTAAGLTALVFDSQRTCLPVATTASESSFTNTVAVSRSARYSCQIALTAAELETLCTSSTGLQQYLTPSATLLGKWGNSTVHNVDDWVTVENEAFPSTVTGTWAASTRTCSNLVTGLHWDIFTADYGAITNRQRAIVGAKTSWTRGSWVHSGAASKTFSVTVTVDHHHYPDGGVVEVSPRGPPVLPSLPEDFLYPFTLNNAGVMSNPAVMLVLLGAVVLMMGI